ncbi:Inactive protein of metal-dependent protease family, putative molecular chaperone [Staphylococcus simiae]|nr:Inactive protein of metal-dependent protease family, putative molecular chaperone [Staphylococcus simiae]
MMNSLLIDTSNQPLSVALMQDDDVLAKKTTDTKLNHSVQLMPAINELFEQSTITKHDIDAIIVAEGPGSYTGLRIGVTVAKTLAFALNTELYGVSSLAALAATVNEQHKLLVPIFDARRQAVYAGIYQWQDQQLVSLMEDQYITIEALLERVQSYDQPYAFIGRDTQSLADLLDGEKIDQLPQAQVMKKLITEPVNIHTFVPKYHKLAEAERNWINKQKHN